MSLPDYLYEVNIVSITVRLILAVLFSGIIGLERGADRHPAGFRTHILVCVGATLAMMTNQFIYETLQTTDVARLGAQVITGVGFLGVGTILITGGGRKIKGLTTAAGLWASACLGLALGIGFYSGAIACAIAIFISLALLPRVENYFYRQSKALDLYVEIDTIENFKLFKSHILELNPPFCETIFTHSPPIAGGAVSFRLAMRLPKGLEHQEAIDDFNQFKGIKIAEEI